MCQMQVIKEHIKKKQYKPVYLLYGTEDYLKRLYKEKLKDAMLDGSDSMNYTYFEGKGIDLNQVMEISETLPFFFERRLVIIENSDLFKSANNFGDYVKRMPETTHIVFVEKEIDKRNKLYKIVKEKGTISEMNGMNEKNLILWMVSILNHNNKKATQNTLLYLLNKVGADMDLLVQELEKLICYVGEKEVIETYDMDAICTNQITGKIFQMIEAIGLKKQVQALQLYRDLLTLREKPMSILYLITRHFNLLWQIKELEKEGYPTSDISQKTKVPPFAVKKYISQANSFTTQALKNMIGVCIETEEQVKTGRMSDQMGVELLIVSFSQ